jgi:hypothetical protein
VALLISKIQNRKCEKGEFHEIAERNLEDSISLLLNFPWEKERYMASVQLTCPSVTVEHPSGTCLKIGPYFSGKFSLYYLSSNNKVYFKPASTLKEAAAWIARFFGQEGILTEFSSYGLVVKPAAHFRTNPFEYTVGSRSTRHFFKGPFITALLVLIMWFPMHFVPVSGSIFGFPLFMLAFLLIVYSPLIYLYFNYRIAGKEHYLQLSRGRDFFIFGTKTARAVYNKQDILAIKAIGRHYSKSPWNACQIFTIDFEDGDQIAFTSLLIPEDDFRRKFPDHDIQEVKRYYPFL